MCFPGDRSGERTRRFQFLLWFYFQVIDPEVAEVLEGTMVNGESMVEVVQRLVKEMSTVKTDNEKLLSEVVKLRADDDNLKADVCSLKNDNQKLKANNQKLEAQVRMII